MFVIAETQIEEQVVQERFACDLSKCKGACCTLPGGRGAPLDDDEIAELQRAMPSAKKYLSQKHRDAIDQIGSHEGIFGSYATTCIDDRECVFVFYDDGIARCSLEKAYQSGETQWRKPLSCHLFPIRISRGTVQRVRYEKISECAPGRTSGREQDVPLYEYLRDPLIRKFGESWYKEFLDECQRRNLVTAIPAERNIQQIK
jgi:hypothetical protein